MESYPTEILVHIFKQLFDLKSLTKCYNTNSRWEAIIEKLFKDNSKLVIVCGWIPEYNVSECIQVIDLINPSFECKWNHVRAARVSGSSIGKIAQPIIFHGRNFEEKIYKNGIILQSNEEFQLVKHGRHHKSSSIVLNDTRLWVTGGKDERNGLNASKFILFNQSPEEGPMLPFTVSHHCMVQVDSKTIYLIGGKQDGKKSHKTWIIDPTNNFEITEGPSMNIARYSHSCATMRIDNKIFIVVFGGWDGHGSVSVEILDTSLPTNNWKLGPAPPFAVYANKFASTLLTSPTTKGVIFIGGSKKHIEVDTENRLLYELSGDAEDNLTWSLLEKKLDPGRSICLAKRLFANYVKENRLDF